MEYSRIFHEKMQIFVIFYAKIMHKWLTRRKSCDIMYTFTYPLGFLSLFFVAKPPLQDRGRQQEKGRTTRVLKQIIYS